MDSTFTITNDSDVEIDAGRMFFCYINMAVLGRTVVTETGIQYGNPLRVVMKPHGDAESVDCIKKLGIVGKYLQPQCVDITFGIQYSVVPQPGVTKKKEFRRISRAVDGFEWHPENLGQKGSECGPTPEYPQ